MPDPFDLLRAPVTPVDPDPSFASALRARVERGLALPRGVSVSKADAQITASPEVLPMVGREPFYRAGEVGYAWLSVPDLDR